MPRDVAGNGARILAQEMLGQLDGIRSKLDSKIVAVRASGDPVILHPGDRVKASKAGRVLVTAKNHARVGTVHMRDRHGTVFVRWDGLKSDQGWAPSYFELVERAEGR